MTRFLLRLAALVAPALAAAPRLFAQSCAMCYATAQAQDARAARHLDYAILALLIPSVSLFAGVFIAAMSRSMRDQESAESTSAAPAPGSSVPPSVFPSELSPES